jgi:hypothetical protein
MAIACVEHRQVDLPSVSLSGRQSWLRDAGPREFECLPVMRYDNPKSVADVGGIHHIPPCVLPKSSGALVIFRGVSSLKPEVEEMGLFGLIIATGEQSKAKHAYTCGTKKKKGNLERVMFED